MSRRRRFRWKSWRRRLGTVVRIGVPLLLLACVVLWLCFQHRPAWYRPALLDDGGVERASRRAIRWAAEISDRMVRAGPFDVFVTETELNEFAVVLPALFPDAFQDWPEEISGPAVAFRDGLIHVGLLCEYGGWRAVVVLRLTVTLSGDGRSLRIALSGIRGGALPIPRGWISASLRGPLGRLKASIRPRVHARYQSLLNRIDSLDDLVSGVRIPNRFVWPNGKRPFRLTVVEVGDRRLRIRVQPM